MVISTAWLLNTILSTAIDHVCLQGQMFKFHTQLIVA